MKRIIALACIFTMTGCATTWAVSEIGLGRPPFDENSREETVPMPGVEETLTLNIHFAGKTLFYAPRPSAEAATHRVPMAAAPAPDTALHVDCQVLQTGQETTYRAATRYGKKWKYTTATMFVLEGALAALYLLHPDSELDDTLAGAFLAADAIGTGALFFVPSRDTYDNTVQLTTTPVRNDCPEGITLELAGRTVPVDARGKIGELGAALVQEQMQRLDTPIRVRLGEQVIDIPIDAADRCAWAQRTQHPESYNYCSQSGTLIGRTNVEVMMVVPLGTLIGLSSSEP